MLGSYNTSNIDGKHITIPMNAAVIVGSRAADEYPTFYGRITVLRGATAVLSGVIIRAPSGSCIATPSPKLANHNHHGS